MDIFGCQTRDCSVWLRRKSTLEPTRGSREVFVRALGRARAASGFRCLIAGGGGGSEWPTSDGAAGVRLLFIENKTPGDAEAETVVKYVK